MFDREASHTALATAYLRAAHQLLDAQPRILDDPIAVRLLGNAATEKIYGTVERYQSPEATALRSHVVLRSRFAEDRLAAAVERGVTQYVILGAGFDTFAFRQPSWAQSLRIFEVDHPNTQAAKRSYLAEAGIPTPINVAFAPINFENESLHDGLFRHSISVTTPTFFAWLGVTMYLNEAAIDSTLRCMAAFSTGSEVVLTFKQPLTNESDTSRESALKLAQRVASVGEPYVSFFTPEAIKEKLLWAGFTTVEFLSPAEADARYFKQRKDIPTPQSTAIVYAIR